VILNKVQEVTVSFDRKLIASGGSERELQTRIDKLKLLEKVVGSKERNKKPGLRVSTCLNMELLNGNTIPKYTGRYNNRRDVSAVRRGLFCKSSGR
jgi:hypothetical protein